MNGLVDRSFELMKVSVNTSVPPCFGEVAAYLRGIADAAVAFPPGARPVSVSDLDGRVFTTWPTKSSFAMGRKGGARTLDLEAPRPLTIRYGEATLTLSPQGAVAPASTGCPPMRIERGGARFVSLQTTSDAPYALASLRAARNTLPFTSAFPDVLDAIFANDDDERPSCVRLRVPELPEEWYSLGLDVDDLFGT